MGAAPKPASPKPPSPLAIEPKPQARAPRVTLQKVTVVIQCASSKTRDAGYFRALDGRAVVFVADPASAPPREDCLYARPDDAADDGGGTWRDQVRSYDVERGLINPFGLRPAYQIYTPAVYRDLVAALGVDRVYVLSAGWGLIRADFLTPNYDITFSHAGARHTRRRLTDRYLDFRQMSAATPGPVMFLGGQSYVATFAALTADLTVERIILHAGEWMAPPPGCRAVKYKTTARTNWHYLCARDILAGRLKM